MRDFDRHAHRVVVAGFVLAAVPGLTAEPSRAQSHAQPMGVEDAFRTGTVAPERPLRPDGTPSLERGCRGIDSGSGWRMGIGPTNAPHFASEQAGAPRSMGDLPEPGTTAADPADVSWDDRFTLPNGVDSNIQALALDGDGNLYVAGRFYVAGGVSAIGVAKWDGTNWSALGSGIDSTVLALAVDGTGNLYAGGSFTTAGGVAAHNVAKWDGTSWSALGSGIGGSFESVNALAVDGAGNLYAGGSFETAGAVSAANVAKWDGTSWSALGAGIGSAAVNPVRSLLVDGTGNLYVGGLFTTAGGVSARNIAKWNGTSWSGMGSGLSSNVFALAIDGGSNLYAGGSFTSAGGVSANRVARWDGTAWSALGDGTNAVVYGLAVDGAGALYAGGALTAAGGVSASRVARWDGGIWSAVGSGTDGWVRALAADDAGRVWAGGEFGSAGSVAASHVARWDGSGWWAPGTGTGLGMNSKVSSLLSDGAGHVYAGGPFSTAGEVVANHVAIWDGAMWSDLGSGMNSNVLVLAMDGAGNVYAGGQFTSAGGVSANYVAKWDGASWSALGAGMGGAVYTAVSALAVDGTGMVYAGGDFTTAGAVSAKNVAKWDGTNWTALGAGLDGLVYSLVVDGEGNLYAGGLCWNPNSGTIGCVAKWDGVSWSPLGSGMVDPYGHAEVRVLVVDDSGNLYAGGWFSSAGGVSATNIARWNGASWSALGTGTNGPVFAMTLDGAGNLYTGAPGLGSIGAGSKWDGTEWSALGSGLDWYVQAMAVDEVGNLFAGGEFVTAGGKVSSHIALWRMRRTITATAGSSGTITPNGAVAVTNGDEQAFAITPSLGYHVLDVLVDGKSVGAVTSYTFPRVTSDHTIAASFAIDTHILAVSVLGSGAVIRSTDQPQYDHGTTVLLSAMPAPGRIFAGWSGDAGGVERAISVLMDRDKTVIATFCLEVPFELRPRDLNLKSAGKRLTGWVSLPAPYRASQIDVASIRLNGVLPVSGPHPAKIEANDTALKVTFALADVEPTLTPGEVVNVSISGTLNGDCFLGAGYITVVLPQSQ